MRTIFFIQGRKTYTNNNDFFDGSHRIMSYLERIHFRIEMARILTDMSTILPLLPF